ncbi:hypothetical protein ACEWY4_017122 [Coilia grayii]|uniref:NACHT LRR and PYD domain-containing protein n=1 Tax=Coilia grayii TaxID=363190 RepID=A0ABD1JFX2_9TELE
MWHRARICPFVSCAGYRGVKFVEAASEVGNVYVITYKLVSHRISGASGCLRALMLMESDPSLQPQQHTRAPSPVPSCVSLKSDWSMPIGPNFSNEPVPPQAEAQTPRAPSPVPSCVSLKSDWSMPVGPNFSNEPVPPQAEAQTPRAPSPVPSCVSLKSDWSMPVGPNFSNEPVPPQAEAQTPRAPSPVPSCVSLKSDWSMPVGPNFSNEPVPPQAETQTKRPASSTSSSVALKRVRATRDTDEVAEYVVVEPSKDLIINQSTLTSSKETDADRKTLSEYKAKLKSQFENVHECVLSPETQKPHESIYVDLYITEGQSEGLEALSPLLQKKSNISSDDISLAVLLKNAVNRALESKSGQLDLFVRFLHGMAMESNQKVLQGLLMHLEDKPRCVSNPKSVKTAIQNLKDMTRKNISPDRWINLLHCLVEMHDSSADQEVQAFLKSETRAVKRLKLTHCSALANTLFMAAKTTDEFDLKKYKTSDEGRRRLVPAVRCCRKALLADCKLTLKCCEVVALALKSPCSPLKELDMSRNSLHDSGVEQLCSGLRSLNCLLETLRLSACHITGKGCESLASALRANPAHLRELYLDANRLGEAELKPLMELKEKPNSALKILRW